MDRCEESRVSTARSTFSECMRLAAPGTPWRLILGLALGLLLLTIASHGVKLAEVWAGLLRVKPGWVAPSLLTVLATTAAKVCRWRALFAGTRRPDFSSSSKALLVGQMVNVLLPARFGEIVRAYLVREWGGAAAALGTIAVEKVFDTLFLSICGGLTVALVPLPSWLDVSLLGLAAGGFLFLVLMLAWPQERTVAWFGRWGHRLPWGMGGWLTRALQRGLAGLRALRQPRPAAVACAWSAAIWALAGGTNFLLFRAFDLRLPCEAAVLLLVLLHVGVAPPSSPGRLGVFHAITVLALTTFGVGRSSGLAYATVLHAIVYLPQIVPGAVLLGFGHRSSGGSRS
jgi:uncharacterized protein (TIRG00374 family)